MVFFNVSGHSVLWAVRVQGHVTHDFSPTGWLCGSGFRSARAGGRVARVDGVLTVIARPVVLMVLVVVVVGGLHLFVAISTGPGVSGIGALRCWVTIDWEGVDEVVLHTLNTRV